MGNDTNYTSAEQLAGTLSTLSMREITDTRDDLLCSSTGDLCSTAMKADSRFSGEKLHVFHPAPESEIKELFFSKQVM